VPPPTDVTVFAPAKINLYLHVGDRRADGYHELESLVAFADIGDSVHVSRADRLSLVVDGPFADGLTGVDNIVPKAAQAFAVNTGQIVPVRIVLTKNLPVASGIGGGSGDAAATLRALDELYPGSANEEELHDIALALGSDVPACLISKPLLMRGRGERLSPLSAFPETPIVLVNPRVALATAAVFRRLDERSGTGNPALASLTGHRALVSLLKERRNDLEAPARDLEPAIGDVLDELARMPGILLARMSGSGATCFGIFDRPSDAEMAAIALSHSNPAWWVKAAKLG
jgi:4-diphosphocytidyl-2-C-methyl-D-erythritol kinase